MKRGRKPKPTALKILEGGQPCRINYDEPRYAPGDVAAPDWLDDLAKAHWDELAPLLAGSRILAAADRAALAVLCDDYSRWRLDPAANKAKDRYVRMLVEFGLTPSSRSRIKAPPEKPSDEAADLNEFLRAQ